MKLLVICVVLCAAPVAFAGHEKYEGHQLYRVSGNNEDIGALQAYLDLLSLIPAERSASGKLEAILRLSPEDKTKWLQHFDQKNMAYTKIADNLADILRDEETQIQASREAAKQSGRSMTWSTYYRYSDINSHLDQLAAAYPNVLTVENAGTSYEGRQVKVVKISTTGFRDETKPVIIIDAMVHAREWVTTPVAMYIIHQLVVNNADRRLLEEIDWLIIPLANPDGYEYSMQTDRMWRKTRSKNHTGSDQCPGVDGNRNFDHAWGTSENSANPCAIIYEGPTAFSEPEIRVIRDSVLTYVDRAGLYLSLHSYGNMFLYAWGNNGTVPHNAMDLHNAGYAMSAAINQLALAKAARYVTGNAANILYFTTGTSRDWTRAAGIPLTYTLELPAYEYGFLVPPTYVQQIVTETWAGVVQGAYYVINMNTSSSASYVQFSFYLLNLQMILYLLYTYIM